MYYTPACSWDDPSSLVWRTAPRAPEILGWSWIYFFPLDEYSGLVPDDAASVQHNGLPMMPHVQGPDDASSLAVPGAAHEPVPSPKLPRSPSTGKASSGAHRRVHSFEGVRGAEVVGYHVEVNEYGKEYASFRINVQRNARHWTVHRRYSDFVDLHNLLAHKYPSAVTQSLVLPKKRLWKRNKFDPAQMEERRLQLAVYIDTLLSIGEIADDPVVAEFLSHEWRTPRRREVARSMNPQKRELLSQWNGKTSNGTLIDSTLPPREIRHLVARTQQFRAKLRALEERVRSGGAKGPEEPRAILATIGNVPIETGRRARSDGIGNTELDSVGEEREAEEQEDGEPADRADSTAAALPGNSGNPRRGRDFGRRSSGRVGPRESARHPMALWQRHQKFQRLLRVLASERPPVGKGTPARPPASNTNAEVAVSEWHIALTPLSLNAEAVAEEIPFGAYDLFPSKKQATKQQHFASVALKRRTSLSQLHRRTSVPSMGEADAPGGSTSGLTRAHQVHKTRSGTLA